MEETTWETHSYTLRWILNKGMCTKEYINFPNIYEPPQNSWCQRGYMMSSATQGPTNIMHHQKKKKNSCAHLCVSVDLTFLCPTPHICNVQHNVQNVKCHIILSGLMQHLFKFWSFADHYRHLILAKQLIHLA